MDLFEYMRQQIGCSYISDLHYRQKEVLWLFQKIDDSRYSKEQLNDFCQYVFDLSYDEFLKKINGKDEKLQ